MTENYLCKKSLMVGEREIYTKGKTYSFQKINEGILNYRLEGNGNGGLGVFYKREMRLFNKHFKLMR